MSVSGNQQRQVILSATNVVSSAAASTNANNTWSQIIASTSAPILITAINTYSYGGAAGNAATVAVGTGAAASEVVIWSAVTSWAASSNSSGGPGCAVSYVLAFPIRVPAGTRVAVRNDNVQYCGIGISYVLESAVV